MAAVMHLAGLAGLALGMEKWFSLLTPFNLLVMFALLVWTMPERSTRMFLFFLIAFLTGFFCEMVGVRTGYLFGQYSYGEALGPKIMGVPVMIGINWFIVVYASGLLAQQIRHLISQHVALPGRAAYSRWFGVSVIFDGALLATFFDWVMEPAAVQLGFWSWSGGQIPLLNYLTWFGVSLVVLSFFSLGKFRPHSFAIHLLIIQALFFFLAR